MKASELRIGNYVNYKDKIIGQATGILSGGIWLDKGNEIEGCLCLTQFKPIPLTEEWLLKFGFEWNNFALRFNKYCIRKLKDNEFEIYMSNEGYQFMIKLKYVHQLQNLYFAIIGKELTIGGQE